VADTPLVEDMSWGPVKLTLTVSPSKVRLDRDLLLTVTVSAPSEMEVALPDLRDRLKGFILGGAFDKEPVRKEGQITQEHCYRLTPVISPEYRLAPIPLVYTDKSRNPSETRWFATRPLVFESLPVSENVDDNIKTTPKPRWIRPSFAALAGYAGILLLVLGLIALALYLMRRVHQQIRDARLSPRERALNELARLLARHLIEKDRVKDFYVELTMIVRRYIERAHSIHAPEQTTEEFLAAASHDPRFQAATLLRLRSFLQAADLVKFAAHHPDPASTENSVATARDYIETDSALQPQGTPANPGTPGTPSDPARKEDA
jgi:hypothetical protein